MQLRPSNGAVLLTAGLAIAVLLGPFVLRGDSTANARLAANRRQVAEMTEAERARLLRNYQRWQQMPAHERTQWLQFADSLQQNRAELGPLLEDYYDWLQTIPGYRRDQLRAAPNVTEKVALVEEITAAQLADRLEAPAPDIQRFGERFEVPILSAAELDDVMEALEGGLLPQERGQLVDRDDQELVGLERHLMTLSLLGKRYGGSGDGLSQRVAQSVLDALPEHARNALMRPNDRFVTRQVGNRVLMTILLSVRAEMERTLRSLRPTPDKLQAHFESLPPDDQEQLLGLSASEFTTELTRRYFQSEVQSRVDLNMNQLRRLMSTWGRGPRPNGRSSGDGPRRDFGSGDRLPIFGGPRGRPAGLRPAEGDRDAPPGDRGDRPPPRRDGERPPQRDGDRPPPGNGDRGEDQPRERPPRAANDF